MTHSAFSQIAYTLLLTNFTANVKISTTFLSIPLSKEVIKNGLFGGIIRKEYLPVCVIWDDFGIKNCNVKNVKCY